MADLDLRTAARAASAFPSPEAEAAFLRARLRAGTLSLERLELAAYCGHEGARATLDARIPTLVTGLWHDEDNRPVHTTENSRTGEWVAGLSRWGPAVQVRAAVAAARVAWGEAVAAEQRRPSAAGLLSMAAINAVEQWLKDPNEGNRIDAARAFLAARPVDAGLQFRWLPMVPTRYQAGTHPTPEGGGWGEEPPYPGPSLWHPGEIMAAAELAGEAPIRAAIQSALIAWALA